MELVAEIAAAMASEDVPRIATLRAKLDSTPSAALGLNFEEDLELRIAVADWLVEQGAADQAIEMFKAILARLRNHLSPNPLLIAQVEDRLSVVQMAAVSPMEAAETLHDAIALSVTIEGGDSKAVQWRWEQAAQALRRSGDVTAAEALDKERARFAQKPTVRLARRRTAAASEVATGSREFELVTVHFGTHRARTGRTNPYDFFRGKRNLPMTYGRALVSVPRQREVGTLPTPPSWMAEERANPARYFVLKSIDVVDSRSTFFDHLKQEVGASDRKEALVFIHGYNTSFARAALRAAQLAVDLEIDGATVLYSWPSKGNVLSYLMDRNEAVAPVVSELGDFIRDVAHETGATRVHLVAHSMGGEFLLKALELLDKERKPASRWLPKLRAAKPSPAPLFSEIIFASPDVDALDFADRVPTIAWLGKRVTVYSSSKDLALKWSKIANGEARAGASAELLARIGVDCIDTTHSGADLFGHDDYVTAAMDDLRSIVWLSLHPRRRRALRELAGPNGVYWVHDLASLGDERIGSIRQALMWARRLGIDEACGTASRFLKGPVANADAAAQEALYKSLLDELAAMREPAS